MTEVEPTETDKETDPLIHTPLQNYVGSHSSTQLPPAEARAPPKLETRRGLPVVVLILTTEMCERLAYYSIVAGLVLYCTSNLGIEQAAATTLNQVFAGFVYLVPVAGGLIADSYLGRFRTIYISCIFYVAGEKLRLINAVTGGANDIYCLTVRARPLVENMRNVQEILVRTTINNERRALFLTGLALVGVGTGGIKANVGPFGAEQVESRGKEAVQSFFNWFYWVINLGALIAFTVVAYVQQEVSFAWGFFIPTLSMGLAAIVFVLGQANYQKTKPKGKVKYKKTKPKGKVNYKKTKPKEGSEKKILARSKKSFGGRYDDHLVDGVASVVKVIPFVLLSIMFWAVNAQMSNTFFAQAERMDIRLGSVNIPAAALNAFNTIGIIVLIPLVDKVVYPFFERIGRPLTYLKRIGIGMVFAAAGVTVAGVVEIYRKKELEKEGGAHIQVLAGENFTASSMSVFMQVPQFLLIGTSEIFTSVAALEFAYNQAPVAMQGLLTGLFLASSGAGNWLSTAILSIVEAATKHDPWWSDEINEAKMENLMFLMAGLMLLNTALFSLAARRYTYQDPSLFQAGGSRHRSWRQPQQGLCRGRCVDAGRAGRDPPGRAIRPAGQRLW
ncbi:hypothetical protein EGW08_009654 [Elysia chlorotica]|uniref:Major facilitator superfamily (MFS) profile domain-containing protein n=1 Tax=Elysia chlorotica TaxID=188477 RepID=A0A3S1B8V6_ELYCH|nr:hypothetical protein EGW08_009654 [Elysia chlorotica]